MEQPEIKVGFVQTKSIMTKSNAPLGGYSVNPYVGLWQITGQQEGDEYTPLTEAEGKIYMDFLPSGAI